MADGCGGDAERVESVEPADTGAFAAHARVAQQHALQARLRRQIGRVDATVGRREGRMGTRIGWQNGYAVEDEWGHSCCVKSGKHMCDLRTLDVLPSGRFLRRV